MASIAQISEWDARIRRLRKEANEASEGRAATKSAASICSPCTDRCFRFGKDVNDANVFAMSEVPVMRTKDCKERSDERVSHRRGDIQPRMRSFSRRVPERLRYSRVSERLVDLDSAAVV